MGWANLIGSGISAAGQIAEGKQNAADAETNRRISMAQAQDALLRGTLEEQRYRRTIAMVAGAQKAHFGSRNVTMSGSALDALADTGQIGGEDIQTIRANAARQAWGYRNQANESSRWGQNQLNNSYAGAGSTLLTAGAQAYGQWKAA
jgi:hypothetical protein